MKPTLTLLSLLVLALASLIRAGEPSWPVYVLGSAEVSAPSDRPVVRVTPATVWSQENGYGFEPGFAVRDGRGSVTAADGAFYFTVAVPTEGNYRVTLVLGDAQETASTRVKAELRRVMTARIDTKPAEFVTQRFLVNVRTPDIAARNGVAAGRVRLKAPRETTQEAWAWDRAITLEFNGPAPHVQSVTIEPAPDVPTVFLLGDSTVCDQSREPYASWGQMFTAFFDGNVAIANHGESGETYRDSIARRRVDKVISVMRPGDYLLMQFGHNDQKQLAAGTGGPFTTYAAEMRAHIAAVRRVGGIPVVISPMERRGFAPDGSVMPSLADYAAASAQVAAAEHVAYVDLNARSRVLYAAFGPAASAAAFAAPDGKQDNTHHNNYGAWLIAACVADGLREAVPALAAHLRPDLPPFDPAHPPAEASVHVPASPLVTHLRPLGD